MQLRGFNELKVKIQSKNTKRTQRKATAGTGLNSPKAKKNPIRKAINPKANKPDRIQNQGKDPKVQREMLGKRLGGRRLRMKMNWQKETQRLNTQGAGRLFRDR